MVAKINITPESMSENLSIRGLECTDTSSAAIASTSTQPQLSLGHEGYAVHPDPSMLLLTILIKTYFLEG